MPFLRGSQALEKHLDVGSGRGGWGDDKAAAGGAAKDIEKAAQALVGEVRESGVVPYSELSKPEFSLVFGCKICLSLGRMVHALSERVVR